MTLPMKAILAGAAALLLAAFPAAGNEKALHAAARAEGSLTWYISHYSSELAQDVGRSFTEKYPGVAVNVVRTTAQVAYQRLNQDIAAGVANCDVFSSTDIGHYAALHQKKAFAEYTPQAVGQLAPEFRKYAKEGFYYPSSAGLVLLTYNSREVKEADAPKNWPDLVDPKWKGRVALGHPAFSGYVGTWAVQMRKLYGLDYFKKLERNRPHIGRSINDTVTVLNSGERLVAAGPEQTTLESAARGNPVAIAYPSDGTLLMIGPSAILKNAPHPNAARLFAEFLLSEEYSKLLVRYRGIPMRADVAPPEGLRALKDIKILRPSEAEIIAGIPEVIEDWRDVFGN